MFGFKEKAKDTSVTMSLPKSETVHGIEVKKVPIGKYLVAMDEIKELPEKIIKDLFPGLAMKDIWAKFANINDEGIIELVSRALMICPGYVIGLLSTLLDIDKEKIMNELTPKEMSDVIKKYWQLNDMTDFFKDVSGLLKKMLPTLANGSKSGLR